MLATSPARIETPRLILGLPDPALAPAVAAFYARNEAHFRPWDPPRPPDFATEKFWRTRLDQNLQAFVDEREIRLFSFLRDASEPFVVNAISFTNIQRGPLQACNLGYAQDEAHVGRGLMHEALSAAISWVFRETGLHRIEANHLPTNERSARVLRRLGFHVEGYSRDYLFIAGAWRDHVRTALTNPNPEHVAIR